MGPLAPLALLAACEPASNAPPPPPPPEPVALTLTSAATALSAAVVTVTASSPADVAVACVRQDLPAEVHLLEGRADPVLELSFAGLLAATGYDCHAAAVSPGGPPATTSFRTPEPPPELVSADVVRHPELEPTGDYTVMTVRPECHGRGSSVVVLDADGQNRWRYDLPAATNIGVEVTLDGPDRFLWGGGRDPAGAPTVVDVTDGVVWRLAFPGSEDVVFHHDVHRLADQRILSVEEEYSDGWAAFQLRLVDEAGDTSWLWNAARGVEDGWLSPGDEDHRDPHHLNWADVIETPSGLVAYASLCYIREVVAIDVATGDLRWSFGPGGDFELFDPAGAPIDDFPECQHGLQTDGTHLLVYDNGHSRGATRAVEFTLDLASGRATRTWEWHDEGFYEPYHGGVDWLDAAHDRVLVAEGNNGCDEAGRHSQIVEVDRPSDTVVHRLVLKDVAHWIYRAHRVDGCDLFANVRTCDTLASRLETLRPALGL
jgi:hypothetical protein